jgi:hypothetical protein
MKQQFNTDIEYEKTHKLNLYPDSNKQHIIDSTQELSQQIGLKRIEQKKTLKVLLCNLYLIRNEKIRTPRAKKSLGSVRYNPLNIGYSALNTVLKLLDKHKFVKQEIGFRDVQTNESRMTTIVATDKLSDWFNEYQWTHTDISWAQEEYLIFRKDNKAKELIDYVDGERSNKLRDALIKYNQLINDTEIILLDKIGNIQNEYFDLTLRRIFISHNMHEANSSDSDLFAFGGRMYAPWCSLNEKQRSRITINGDKTVEIDLEASHINAMYRALTGKPYQYGDPYEDLHVDGYLIPRHIVKQIATMMQFTKNTQGTTAGLERHYFPLDDSFVKKRQSEKELQRAQEYKEIKSVVKPGDIVRKFLAKHKDIAWYYQQGKMMGHHIQYWESNFVFSVVNQLTDNQIPVLTVYDSFIVQEQHKPIVDELIKNTVYKDS